MSMLATRTHKWFPFMPLKYKFITNYYINNIVHPIYSTPIIINHIIMVNAWYLKIFEPIVIDIIEANDEKSIESLLKNLKYIVIDFERQTNDSVWDKEMLDSLGIVLYHN